MGASQSQGKTFPSIFVTHNGTSIISNDFQNTLAWKFMQTANRKYNLKMQSWDELHAWSVHHHADFWGLLLEEYPLIHEGTCSKVVDENARMDSIPRWYVYEIKKKENLTPVTIHHPPNPIQPSSALSLC